MASSKRAGARRGRSASASDTNDNATGATRAGATDKESAVIAAAETAANGDALFFAGQTVAGAARLAHEGDAWRGIQDAGDEVKGTGLDARGRRPVQL